MKREFAVFGLRVGGSIANTGICVLYKQKADKCMLLLINWLVHNSVLCKLNEQILRNEKDFTLIVTTFFLQFPSSVHDVNRLCR